MIIRNKTAVCTIWGCVALISPGISHAAGPLTVLSAGTYSGTYTSTDPAIPAIVIKATSGAVVFNNCTASNSNVNSVAPTVLVQPTTSSTATVTFNNCKISNASKNAGTGQPAPAIVVGRLAGPTSFNGRASTSSLTNNLYPCTISNVSPTSNTVIVDSGAPVTIQKCTISGKKDLIASTTYGASKLYITENKATGVNPGLATQAQGRFMRLLSPTDLSVIGNYLENTAGVYVNGNGYVPTGNIIVKQNSAKNINGRYSDGAQGYVAARVQDQENVQFLQFDKVVSNPGKSIVVSWNQIINLPGQSNVEDNINLGSSSGTASFPLIVSNNFIRGGYPTDLTAGYSGGGIITDTAPGGLICNFITIDSNQVVDTVNYGIAVSDGFNIKINNNRMVGENKQADGTVIKASNVGMYIANTQHRDAAQFKTNVATNNVSGWMGWSHQDLVTDPPSHVIRNDYYFPEGCPNVSCDVSPNTSIIPTGLSAYDPLPIGSADAEQTIWANKLKSNNLVVGPSWK